MTLIPTNNIFLPESEREIQSLAYYGRFLALQSLDDGWKQQYLKHMLDFLANIELPKNEDKIEIEVIRDETSELVEIILKAEWHSEKTQKFLYELTRKLQEIYYCTSVREAINSPSIYSNFSLPITAYPLPEDHEYYPRTVVQDLFAQLENTYKQISQYTYTLDTILSISKEDWDEYTQLGFIEEQRVYLHQLISDLHEQVEELKQKISELVAEFYLMRSCDFNNSPSKIFFSRNLATQHVQETQRDSAKDVESQVVFDNNISISLLEQILEKIWKNTTSASSENSHPDELLDTLSLIQEHLKTLSLAEMWLSEEEFEAQQAEREEKRKIDEETTKKQQEQKERKQAEGSCRGTWAWRKTKK